ncbi:MAG: DUF502 domain-containing protein [Lentisphaerae bacterium]|nr:DUF502 domain-containing protein [Lentisphaerota bacterium]
MNVTSQVARHVRARLVSGVLLLVPLAVSFWVLRILFRLILGYVRPVAALMSRIPVPEYVVGLLAVLTLLLLIYAAGTLTRLVLGRRLVAWGESLLVKIPIVKTVYSSTKSVVDMLSNKNRNAFKSVVLIDFPRPGCKAIGFLGGEGTGADGRRWCRVFLPTTPNPTSGFLLLLNETEVTRTQITIEEGIRMVVSGGVLVPEEFERLEVAAASASAPPDEET